MSYNTFGYFAMFLPAVMILYQLCPKKYRWAVLLVSGYIFMGIWSKALILITLAMTVNTYVFGRILGNMKKAPPGTDRKLFKKKKKRILVCGILINLAVLILMKYTNFFGSTFLGDGWTPLKIIAPIGISYYTLQSISYMADIHSGKIAGADRFYKLALYMSFFPTVAEGPITRYSDIGEPLSEGNPITYRNMTLGYQRILWGLFKKVIIADHLAVAVSNLFASYYDVGSMSLLAAVFCTIQLYMDFAGTIDIAIGTGRIFGITIAENFRQPFFAKNASDFWRRWHMTLGGFFRDYIFYPVSLSKPISRLTKWTKNHLGKTAARFAGPMIALLCVWLANGFWHGPNWTYICYGLYYFTLSLIELIAEKPLEKHINTNALWFRIFRFIKLCILVAVGEMFFFASTIQKGWTMFTSIFTNFSLQTLLDEWSFLGLGLSDYLISFACFGVVIVVSVLKEKEYPIREKFEALPAWVRWTFWYVMIFTVLFLGAYGPGFSAIEMMYAGF